MRDGSNITREHMETFHALTSGEYGNFALFSCFADGKPVVAIVAVNRNAEEYKITPLFITPPASVELTDHDGNPCVT